MFSFLTAWIFCTGGSKELVSTLEEIQKTFLYASENYSKVGGISLFHGVLKSYNLTNKKLTIFLFSVYQEECFHLKHRCTRLAHLTKLQIQLLPSGFQVLGLTVPQVKEFLYQHNDFIEVGVFVCL